MIKNLKINQFKLFGNKAIANGDTVLYSVTYKDGYVANSKRYNPFSKVTTEFQQEISKELSKKEFVKAPTIIKTQKVGDIMLSETEKSGIGYTLYSMKFNPKTKVKTEKEYGLCDGQNCL